MNESRVTSLRRQQCPSPRPTPPKIQWVTQNSDTERGSSYRRRPELNWTEKRTNQFLKWFHSVRSLKRFVRSIESFTNDTTLIETAYQRAAHSERHALLAKKLKPQSPPWLCFSTEYNVKVSKVKVIILKHRDVLKSDPSLEDISAKPPLEIGWSTLTLCSIMHHVLHMLKCLCALVYVGQTKAQFQSQTLGGNTSPYPSILCICI